MTHVRLPSVRRAGRRLALVVVAATAFVAATTGVAYAYYSSKGSGTGTTKGATLTVTVTSATTSGSLAPGGPAANLLLTVNNAGAAAAQISAVTVGSITGCTTPAITYTPPSSYPTVATGSSQVTLTGVLSMGTGSSADCQGANLTIPVTVAVKQ